MKEILKSLQTFQQSVKPLKKNEDNPFFKSKYASLDSIQKHIKPALTEAGLVVTQSCELSEGGLVLNTTVWHAASGEKISSVFPIIVGKQSAQEYGSAVSYARRYSLVGLLDLIVQDEDDDGAVASGTTAPPNVSLTEDKYKAMIQFIAEGKVSDVEKAIKKYTMSETQKNNITTLINNKRAELTKKATK